MHCPRALHASRRAGALRKGASTAPPQVTETQGLPTDEVVGHGSLKRRPPRCSNTSAAGLFPSSGSHREQGGLDVHEE